MKPYIQSQQFNDIDFYQYASCLYTLKCKKDGGTIIP